MGLQNYFNKHIADPDQYLLQSLDIIKYQMGTEPLLIGAVSKDY